MPIFRKTKDYILTELIAFFKALIDFCKPIPSFSEIFKSNRLSTPSRPTTDGQPKHVSENPSYEDTGNIRISSFNIQFRIETTHVAIP